MDKSTLERAAEIALEQAKLNGATAAEVGVNQSNGLSVTVRQGDVETLEYNNDKGLGITVYFGNSKASSSTADFSENAIADAVKAACGIAKYTQEDDCAGLADAALMASEFPDLSLYHPWSLDADQAITLATECEQAGFDIDQQISNSEGASVSSHQGVSLYTNSHGFLGHKTSTRHGMSCTLIANDDKGMQRDYWYDVARDANDLSSPQLIGQIAAKNTLRRLNARTVKTGNYPVLFAAELAPSLWGQLISGISGGALYRKASFLLDSLGQQILPDFVHIYEQPHLLKAMGSCNFDGEGVRTQQRDIVQDGVLKGYVLSSYSARKLNMKTTANSGGVHNLTVDSSGDFDLNDMLKKMDRGVLITETMGMGVNIVTGDYSQGAAGFWVENGEIQYPVDEFTIAGNLSDMLKGIQAIGNDIEKRGNTRTGSVLIDNMTIAS